MPQVSRTQILNELKLSHSTLYYLLEAHGICVPMTESGRYIWSDEILETLRQLIKTQQATPLQEKTYKTTLINNRRYLGNKYKLLDFVKAVVESECSDINTVADIFAGTGAVASAFLDKKIISNDTLYFNYLCHIAWFSPEQYSFDKILNMIENYNALTVTIDNYVSEHFADTYFSLSDCRKIGYIREDIENEYKAGNLNFRERAILLTSLIYAMDKIANTCGHYDAFRQNAEFERTLELSMPLASADNNENNQCFNEDANDLVKRVEADLVYIDPPYNSRQYCDAYHFLENIARWEKPEVHGMARKMDRTSLKSDYCTSAAPIAFERLIRDIRAKYILVSYNNMAEKGNARSNARIGDEDIMRILSAKGRVRVFSKSYKAFSAGKSDIKENEERLFLCECYEYGEKDLLQSPLNYIGGKFKLLPQLLPHFPKDINLFVDLFCGGGNVGINADCRRVIFNDNNELLRYLFGTFKNLDKEVTFEIIDSIISEYGLSDTSKYGYEHYGCNSADGLGAYNADKFLRLREYFNGKSIKDYHYFITLYVLIVYAFNNQIRFNRKGEFNLPVGKRDFNDKMRNKLSVFINRLKSGDYFFESADFRELNTEAWNDKTFVYADPPYLITCATYNEQDGWNEALERELLAYLDGLHNRGIRFALSNVLRSKGKENTILLEWTRANMDKYRMIYLDYSYANSNYQTKDKTASAEEVLIVNY
ncbi:MAG: Dam family site-specific DNA-(adenine-N6)-methyltransferase [Clostridiales bacterium]|jgi:adenine-specific DNA-methyltransferase|nr:Dam family site-specific DNA-(adenine-N6)-methyltransferase [Clostridiales bacterium]